MTEDKLRWNTKYREGRLTPLRDTLIRFYGFACKGKALEIACGTGANSIFLAKKGFRVVAIDISEVAINKARLQAKREGVEHLLRFKPMDVRAFGFMPEQYSIVLSFYFLDRSLFRRMERSLSKGGVLIFETYNYKYLDLNPTFDPRYVLNKNELLKSFSGLELLYYSETSFITTFVAKKP